MFEKMLNEGKKFFPGIIAAAVIIGGIVFYSAQTTDKCVNVVIDYGVLDADAKRYAKCLASDGEINALELMENSNFKIQVTDK